MAPPTKLKKGIKRLEGQNLGPRWTEPLKACRSGESGSSSPSRPGEDHGDSPAPPTGETRDTDRSQAPNTDGAPKQTPSNQDPVASVIKVVTPQPGDSQTTATTPSQAVQPRARKPLPTARSSSVTKNSGVMSSQRNRPRGPNRNSEAGKYSEEVALWQSCQAKLIDIVTQFNESSANVAATIETDRHLARMKEKGVNSGDVDTFNGLLDSLDTNLRKGVKINETLGPKIRAVMEEIKILRALTKANEEQASEQSQSFSRAANQRAKESAASSSVYDFDGAGDSPVPSPNPNISRRMGGSKGDRDSVPPKLDRSTPVGKAGSVEPQAGSSNASRTKMTFAVNDEVAFKPKHPNSDNADWILGIVQEVKGEGKSRRYKVLDADQEVEAGGSALPKEFRTSASSMILIPKEGTSLSPLDNGKTVLALYPNTTTFYKAEVIGMAADGKVNLKFEGEESSNTMQSVVRRYVVDYRG